MQGITMASLRSKILVEMALSLKRKEEQQALGDVIHNQPEPSADTISEISTSSLFEEILDECPPFIHSAITNEAHQLAADTFDMSDGNLHVLQSINPVDSFGAQTSSYIPDESNLEEHNKGELHVLQTINSVDNNFVVQSSCLTSGEPYSMEHTNEELSEDSDDSVRDPTYSVEPRVENKQQIQNMGMHLGRKRKESNITADKAKRKKYDTSVKERKEQRLRKEKENHAVRPSCKEICKKKCIQNISPEFRIKLNSEYWNMSWLEKRIFVSNCVSRMEVKRRRTTTENSKRKGTFIYTLKNERGEKVDVCKKFFLTTLGYKEKNDRILTYTLRRETHTENVILPSEDKRGKHIKTCKIDRDTIKKHIESFHPSVSHYRREHAPNKLYLPSDVTIKGMHKDFLENHNDVKISYEMYRKVVSDDMNISFTALGHEECETCEACKLHNPEHTLDNLNNSCNSCVLWKQHIDRAKESRDKYRDDAGMVFGDECVCVSADLEKVIMLPRIDMFKKVVFCQRLVVFNESFVPIGKKQNLKPFAVLWHEAMSGRKKEDLVSTFHAYLLHVRDKEEVIIWMDNCAGQNKNWCLITYLVYIINSEEISAKKIYLRYFEPGHTFMAADSFHHQVELSMKHRKKIYDFTDFVNCVQSANSGKVEVKELNINDFFLWPDRTSMYKIQHINPRPYLKDMVEIIAERGKNTITYRKSFTSTTSYELNFLQAKFQKNGLSKPNNIPQPRGVTEERKNSVLKHLSSLMPKNRLHFWQNLPVNNASPNLINDIEDT